MEDETCTLLAMGLVYGLLAVALYIYHIYYNNTFVVLFFTMLHFQSPQCINTSPVNLLSVFSHVDI